jgi:hypothetical protein
MSPSAIGKKAKKPDRSEVIMMMYNFNGRLVAIIVNLSIIS